MQVDLKGRDLHKYTTPQPNNHLCLNAEVITMKTQPNKFAVLETISSKIGAYLHKIDVVPQEDDSDFDDEEWMNHPTTPFLAHVILDLLLSPTYRLPKTVTAVRIYRDKNIFSVCPRCDVCIEREYQEYCHRCGQYLDWSKLEDAEEIFIGWDGIEDDNYSKKLFLLNNGHSNMSSLRGEQSQTENYFICLKSYLLFSIN